MNTSPVTLAELAHATEDLPLETPAAPTSCGAALATRSLSEVFAAEAEGRDPLAPSPEDIATLTTQYRKAVNGLYEAYLFGQMMVTVKASLTRETGSYGQPAAGSGLKGWLEKHCPEINYKTALRFLSVAEKTNAALILSDEASAGAGEHPLPGEEGAEPPHRAPSEEAVRAYLEGKSQRQLLGRGGAREGAGRSVKSAAEALDRDGTMTWRTIERPLIELNRILLDGKRWRQLNPDDLATLRRALATLCAEVAER